MIALAARSHRRLMPVVLVTDESGAPFTAECVVDQKAEHLDSNLALTLPRCLHFVLPCARCGGVRQVALRFLACSSPPDAARRLSQFYITSTYRTLALQ